VRAKVRLESLRVVGGRRRIAARHDDGGKKIDYLAVGRPWAKKGKNVGRGKRELKIEEDKERFGEEGGNVPVEVEEERRWEAKHKIKAARTVTGRQGHAGHGRSSFD
jgi:hypothetical protein